MCEIMLHLRDRLPPDAILCNGAGNYAGWLHRFHRFRRFGTQLAPTSGAMGYGVPAAVAGKLRHPDRPVVCFAGDGCFLMNGQELATACQYGLPIVVLDRKSVVEGKRVAVRVDLGGRRLIKKKNNNLS